ncbi:hypothetical protein KR009_011554, partial [Drosophila setifemur]
RKMFSSLKRSWFLILWGLYIIAGAFLLECGAKSLADSQSSSENAIEDPTVEYLRSYGVKMKSYMNLSVAPCDDFYEYACGNWKNVRPDRYSPEKRSNLQDMVYTLSDMTEELLTRTQLAEALNMSTELLVAQRFYNACLSADVFPLPAADPAYLGLIRSLGGFPAVDGSAWNSSRYSWFNVSAHLTNYGARALINDDVLPQYPFLQYFKLPELGFDHMVQTDNIANKSSRAYTLNENRMRGYLQAYNLTEDRIAEVISGVFAFWSDALAIADRFDGDETKCLELDSENDTPAYPKWVNYFEIAWNGQQFNEIDTYCNYYYTELEKVCEMHLEAVANYQAMRVLYRMDAKLKDQKYQKQHCLLVVQFSLAHVINQLYIAEHHSEDTRLEVSGMVKELRRSLRQVLENAEWLDAETRREALLKESTMESVIGSYQNKEITERLIQKIGKLSLVDESFPQSMINLRRLHTDLERFNGLHFQELSKDTKPLDLLLAMQVNAFYFNLDNSIYVMAGILHPPAYHHSWPNSLKFGTLGYLVGHELTHGFDTVGSRYDSNGQQRNWYSNKSGAVFEERAKCYVDHYSSYLIPEINRHVNGNETNDENIADNGGLQQSLAAYRRYMKHLQISDEANEPRIERMPGLDLSPEQLFFLGFAQLWCADYKEEHLWDELKEKHTINRYRVLGAISNSQDFAQVYDCPVGSAMHPKSETCRLW